jgi:hypothetical protein
MRNFFARQVRSYHELESGERAWWILQWLFVVALVVGFIGLFAWAIVTGEISKESKPSSGLVELLRWIV